MSARTEPPGVPASRLAPDGLRDARNDYADLLRSVAIVAVVIGHWLATGVVRRDGRFVGVDALGVIHWGSWVTLVLQVVPVFFLVGGYANSASWRRHAAAGEHWSAWVRARVLRLMMPTGGYVGLIAILVVAAELAHANPLALAQAGWGVALHLWFLSAYLVVLLCTPALYAAHRRWELWVPIAMCAAAVAIDVGVVDGHWHVIGWANYLLVWGTFHQLGFAWSDRTMTDRGRPILLAAGSALVLFALVRWGGYPVSMVGVPGARIQNASPPSTALLAFGLAQCGLALAGERIGARWLERHANARRRITRAGRLTMPIYLWHMVPVVVVIEAGYPRLVGLPAVGSARWWEQRIVWIAALSLVLAGLLALLAVGVMAARRQRRAKTTRPRPVVGGRLTSVVGVRLLVGTVAAAVGIGQLAISGFAPHGHLNLLALAVFGLGVVLVRASASLSAFRSRAGGH